MNSKKVFLFLLLAGAIPFQVSSKIDIEKNVDKKNTQMFEKPKIQNKLGDTALIIAVELGYTDIVKTLLGWQKLKSILKV